MLFENFYEEIHGISMTEEERQLVREILEKVQEDRYETCQIGNVSFWFLRRRGNP